MSEAIELVWAKLPSFPQHYHEADNDALVAFLSYVPKIVFPAIRPYWEGYVSYRDKKVAVYKVEVIEALLNETYVIDLDGTRIEKSVAGYPGSLIVNKLLNVCHQSHNALIAKMAFKQRQLLIYSHVKKDLWALFEPSNVIEVSHPEEYKTGTWTSVQANSHEREFDFELMEGKLHYEDHRHEQGHTVIYHRLAHLKNPDDIEKLMKLVTEYKKYGRTFESFYEFDMHSVWAEGFMLETFEPKKSNGFHSSTQTQDSASQNKTDTHQNTHTNNDIEKY